MINKTKGMSLSTIIVVFGLLAAAAIVPWPSIIGTSSTGDTRVVELTVAFNPSPRPVNIVVSVGSKVGDTTPITKSPWGETITVPAGTPVSVHATQVSVGTVSCAIKVNGKVKSHDFSQDSKPAACLVTA